MEWWSALDHKKSSFKNALVEKSNSQFYNQPGSKKTVKLTMSEMSSG